MSNKWWLWGPSGDVVGPLLYVRAHDSTAANSERTARVLRIVRVLHEYAQRAQYGVIKEYTINHIRNLCII